MTGLIIMPSPAIGRAGRTKREDLEAALESTLNVVDHLLAQIDALDGDLDFEVEPDELTASEWDGRTPQRFNVGDAA